jgi:hypothetical protein
MSYGQVQCLSGKHEALRSNLSTTKKKKFSDERGSGIVSGVLEALVVPVVSATREAEVGGPLEYRNLKPTWATQ